MLTLHLLGGLIIAVGVILFAWTLVKGKSNDDESHVEVWKINLSGPPALVLVLIGVLMIVFPYTAWYTPDDPNPPPETVPTTVAANTTLLNPATTLGATLPALIPLAPTEAFVEFDDQCAEDALIWVQPDVENVTGWWLSFESYDVNTGEVWSTLEIDTGSDPLVFGNVSAICETDFVEDVALNWSIWIYAYNDAGFSEPLYVEYADL